MNWGYKILFVYITFVAAVLFMVFKASSQKFDLVTPDYYAKELKYQDKIEEMNRASALSAPVTCVIKDDQVVVQFPKDFAGHKLTGEIILYCPSDENRDIKTPFSVQDEPLTIPVTSLKKGLYELHLNWQDGKVAYYFEKKIIIQ